MLEPSMESKIISSSQTFYQDLPAVHRTSEGFLHPEHSVPVPEDWVVVVTDIVNSTNNPELYREINILAASSVIIAINLGDQHNVLVPFVYGGDGATIVAPPSFAELYLSELAVLRANGEKSFGLHLRIGSIRVSEILKDGHTLSVSKLLINGTYTQAIFFGDGITYAERAIKENPIYTYTAEEPSGKPIDLYGLECKWNEIHPPTGKEEVVCLMVKARTDKYHEQIYREILKDIESAYGDFDERHPIPVSHIGPTTNLQSIIQASRVKFGHVRIGYSLRWFLYGLWSRVNGSIEILRGKLSSRITAQHHELVTASDTLKISGTLMTMFAGTKAQRATLEQVLRDYEARGLLWYGLYPARSSVMTCYINTPGMSRVNFLDAYGGGYTQASRMLKEKIKLSELPSPTE